MLAIYPFTRGRRVFASAVFLTLLLVPVAEAHDYKVGNLVINHPWSRATPGGAKVAGGYMSITNNGSDSDRLVGGSFTDADRVEIHEMRTEGGVMQMRPLANGLEIKPGETVKLEPGGFHAMFVGIKTALKEGDRAKGQLRFEKAGTVDVEYAVGPIGESASSHHKH